MSLGSLITIEKQLKQAKKAYREAQALENKLHATLDNLGIDVSEAKTNAFNANNLEEAISCYLHYDEYSTDELISDIDKTLREHRE